MNSRFERNEIYNPKLYLDYHLERYENIPNDIKDLIISVKTLYSLNYDIVMFRNVISIRKDMKLIEIYIEQDDINLMYMQVYSYVTCESGEKYYFNTKEMFLDIFERLINE